MSLKLKIQDDLRAALKEKREIELSVLRMLSAAISNGEIDKRTKAWKEKSELSAEELNKESQLTDKEIVKIIFSEIKKRKEAVALYEKGNRPELAGKENKETEILQRYLAREI